MIMLSILAGSVIAFLLLYVVITKKAAINLNERSAGAKVKNRAAIIRAANRRLAKNPRDSDSLLSLAELHYEEQDFEESFKFYQKLVDLCAIVPELDGFEITLRHGMTALKTNKYDEAYKSLIFAKSFKRIDFDLDNNLGYLEYRKKNYQRAESLLQSARKLNPEALSSCKYLGICRSKLGKFKDAVSYLSRWLESHPEDKESRFALAKCYYHLTQFEPAEAIFRQLRADPRYGSRASLYSGTIHLNSRNYEQAIFDFEVGLRLENATTKLALELKYCLAAAHVQMKDLDQAVMLLRDICAINPNFRDASKLLKKYKELSANQTFKDYLMASTSQFSILCRRIVQNYFDKSDTRITDVSSLSDDCIDILTEVITRKWEEVVIFRLMRNSSNLGDLAVRNFHMRMKDLRAGRGIFITAGTFNEKAKEFAQARLLDLLDKESLLKLLRQLSIKPS